MNKIVRATAGAGKTTELLEAVYSVYKKFSVKEEKWPKILLSTFTVKAANELSERLISKAVELGDEDFLDYASSSFLEVGTLHSVFLKILDQLDNDLDLVEQTYFSQSHRKKVGRGILHELIKEKSLEFLFTEAKEESDVMSAFIDIYGNTESAPKILGFEVLRARVQERVRELALETEDENLISILNRDGMECSNLLEYIDSFTSKEKKKFKEIRTVVTDEVNTIEFLNKYSEKHRAYQNLYSEWGKRFRTYINENKISSISDVEVQVLNKLYEKKFDKKVWDFCFFDEYQDTSPSQKKIIDIVSSKSENYFVGDPFQSIYFFRGARKEIFLQEFSAIEKSGGNIEYRLNNYRSAPEIVDFINGLTKFILPEFMEMEPAVEGVSGEVKIVHFEEGSAYDECLYVVKALKGIDLQKESVAILSRGSKELLNCGKELRRAGVEHKFSLSKGFESSLEVIELVSFLIFLIEPENDENLIILLMSFWCGVSDCELKTATKKVKEGETSSLWNFFNNHEGVVHLKKQLELVGKIPISVTLLEFVGSSGFLSFSEGLDITKGREQNTLKLIGALEIEEQKKNFNLQGFVDDILFGNYRFESEEIRLKSGCLLMTIHGSKGLQFDHVFVLGMNKASVFRAKSHYFNLEKKIFSLKEYSSKDVKMRYPLAVEDLVLREKKEMLSENRRLFYVAMTRAKKKLLLLGSKKISKKSTVPSWLSLTLDFLKKTEQEDLCRNLDSFDKMIENKENQKFCFGFLLRNEKSNFLDKKPTAVTSTSDENTNTYTGDVERFFKLSLAISKGVFFHEMMERVSDLERASLEIKKYFHGKEDENFKAVEYLFIQDEFPFQEIISSGEKEWRFDCSGERKVSGQIDLWAKIGTDVWIVDYKTGDVDGVKRGFSQLKKYKKMLSQYLGQNTDLNYNLVLTFPYDQKTFIEINI